MHIHVLIATCFEVKFAQPSSHGLYPTDPATAMKEYVCDLCGKTFQTRDDLIHHQEFERYQWMLNTFTFYHSSCCVNHML